ncbi:signal peptidase I [Hazenella coriacea]|uniref:Signal peptidase I n=1 Tax=Hazenella coriacea TaxID=1179467 RepID=A0A4R3L5K8_9BACL|nr:signal peptidase I [Hazenella coriacea]TCS94682.1 signal peptidase I [Hazenella coriacea]
MEKIQRKWVVFGVLIVSAMIGFFIVTQFYILVEVIGTSMEPTFQNGEVIVVEKTDQVKRGEIVYFQYGSLRYIKRVIGVSGDQIEVKNNQIYVNGQPLREPYVQQKQMESFGPITVPEQTLFVLGDDRSQSIDSRHMGFIPVKDLKGRVVFE